MEVWAILEDLRKTRQLLEDASDGVSGFWRFWFASELARVVFRIKQDYKEEFEKLLVDCPGLFEALNLGHQVHFKEKVLSVLDFSTPGRTAAAVAFLTFILDKWIPQTHFSRGYVLDFIATALWRTWKVRKMRTILGYWPVQPLGVAGILRHPPVMPAVLEEEQQEDNPRAGLDPPVEEAE
uniref:E1B protein, small T-antigen n=1 Tax=Human adenovirus 106 TaxID=3025491 RepID=A0AAF0YT43_9ADEN|nr:E1B 20 kDa protein [Human adenovirus 106]